MINILQTLLEVTIQARQPGISSQDLIDLISTIESLEDEFESSLELSKPNDKFLFERHGYFTVKENDLNKNLLRCGQIVSLKDGWSTYPVLKFFRGNFLMEFGYNNKSKWDAHLMYRF